MSGFKRAKFALADRLRRDTRLSPYARLIGLEMISRSWEHRGCTDCEEWFVKTIGASRRTVIEAIKELENFGYIRIERKCGCTNRYFLIFEPVQILHRSNKGTRAEKVSNLGKIRTGTGAENDTLKNLSSLSQNPSQPAADKGHDQASPKIITGGDRGRLEKEIADRIEADGLSDGWAILDYLHREDPGQLDQLCAEQRARKLPNEAIEDLRRAGRKRQVSAA